MRLQGNYEDPGRMLTHASLYLWKQWRQYPLAAWENAEDILHRAYDAVEEEDRIEFVRSLDRLVEPENQQYGADMTMFGYGQKGSAALNPEYATR